MSIEPDVMSGLIDHPGEAPDLARPVIDDGLLSSLVEGVFHAATIWRSGSSALTALAFEEALVESCVFLMARHASAHVPSEAGGSVSAVRDRLAQDLTETPSLAELALLAGRSRYQVLRGFQKQYGLPPHRWLLCLRAERARAHTIGAVTRHRSGGQRLRGSGAHDQDLRACLWLHPRRVAPRVHLKST